MRHNEVNHFSPELQNNIVSYCDSLIVAKLRRPHTPQAVYILSDTNDAYLSEVEFLLNNGSITYSYQIPKPDLESRISHYQHTGYNVEYMNTTF